MNKTDLEKLTDIRNKEAQVLLDAAQYNGAYYLAGYAVECALKACIAKRVRHHDFPDKELASKSYSHDLQKLIGVAKLEADHERELKSNPAFASYWTLMKDWNETRRYEYDVSEVQATEFLQAINDPSNGVLLWVKKFW